MMLCWTFEMFPGVESEFISSPDWKEKKNSMVELLREYTLTDIAICQTIGEPCLIKYPNQMIPRKNNQNNNNQPLSTAQ